MRCFKRRLSILNDVFFTLPGIPTGMQGMVVVILIESWVLPLFEVFFSIVDLIGIRVTIPTNLSKGWVIIAASSSIPTRMQRMIVVTSEES